MKKFEVNKEYTSRSICDSECILKVKILSRTNKTAVIYTGDKIKRTKIHVDPYTNGEYIQPDKYSMSPIYRANNIKQ